MRPARIVLNAAQCHCAAWLRCPPRCLSNGIAATGRQAHHGSSLSVAQASYSVSISGITPTILTKSAPTHTPAAAPELPLPAFLSVRPVGSSTIEPPSWRKASPASGCFPAYLAAPQATAPSLRLSCPSHPSPPPSHSLTYHTHNPSSTGMSSVSSGSRSSSSGNGGCIPASCSNNSAVHHSGAPSSASFAHNGSRAFSSSSSSPGAAASSTESALLRLFNSCSGGFGLLNTCNRSSSSSRSALWNPDDSNSRHLHTSIPTRGPPSSSADTHPPSSSSPSSSPSSSSSSSSSSPAPPPLDPLAYRRVRRAAARAGKPASPQRGRLVDGAKLRACGGQGGAGRVAFEPTGRGRHLTALGGSGGPGGAVVVRANRHVSSLFGIPTVVVAGRGGAGGSGGQTGVGGQERVIEVPLGTSVRLAAVADVPAAAAAAEEEYEEEEEGQGYTDTEEEWEEWEDEGDEGEEEGEDADGGGAGSGGGHGASGGAGPAFGAAVELNRHGEELLVACGGEGGRGNRAFPAAPGRPAHDTAEAGAPGEQVWVLLETRLLADVGFVGLPNAGKSTLLGAITAARAKVGSYAFTTIRPQLGTIAFDDGSRLATADIPGLVQGAHANRGRGNAFLRHIERCRCLAYVIDLSGCGSSSGASDPHQGADPHQGDTASCRSGSKNEKGGNTSQQNATSSSDEAASSLEGGAEGAAAAAARAAVGCVPLSPQEQLRVLQEELRLYNPLLLSAPALVVANKLDRCADPRVALRTLMAATNLPIVPVSAAHGVGLGRLKEALRAIVGATAPADAKATAAAATRTVATRTTTTTAVVPPVKRPIR